MNGSPKIVIDTNIIFMAWYNPFGKCAEVIRKARQNKIQLFSSDSVKKEIFRVFKRHGLNEDEIKEFLNDIPITWVEKEVYESVLNRTKVKHKADKPVETVALILECDILSANKHFRDAKNIDKLLKEIENEDEK